MILSVSRRTDIPRFYFDWFINRLKAGFVLVRNPMNFHQVSRIELSPQTIDCIVFWTKNPRPMLDRLKELENYPYYIQFTINAYDETIERRLPPKVELIDTFKRLADQSSPLQMVWRYSPVLLTDVYTPAYHLEFFNQVCEQLKGYTHKCNLSFIDLYAKIQTKMGQLGITEPDENQKIYLAREFAKIAAQNNISLGACGNLNLEISGIEKSYCIDASLISQLTGRHFERRKDPAQRAECYCLPAVDIGTYDTCLNGCEYCYANHALSRAENNLRKFDPQSPLLCGSISDKDIITNRKVSLSGSRQGNLFS